MLTSSACVLVLASACAEGGSDAGDPPRDAPVDGEGTFTVEWPIQVVAGDGQAWVLTGVEDGALLSRVDVTGRSTEVAELPGQTHDMAPYRDGVVVARVDCADDACAETATEVLVLDGGGSPVAEAELSLEPGAPERSDGSRLLGVQDDLVWVSTTSGPIAYDPRSGETVAEPPWPDGVFCLLDDGLYALPSLSGLLGVSGGGGEEQFDDPYEVEVERFGDERWTPVPGTRRTVPMYQLSQTECVGGAIRTGQPDTASLAWSPASGWVDVAPYTEARTITVPPEPVAPGHGDQRYVLESDGSIRRVFAAPDAPLSVETLQVPADVFSQDPTDAVPGLTFDVSATVVAGCLQQPREPDGTARCYIRST
ncbi:hypothetical protein [Blastococcus sp. SYSU D00813]